MVKKYTEEYKNMVFNESKNVLEKCVMKDLVGKYNIVQWLKENDRFTLSVQLYDDSKLNEEHGSWMKKECLKSSKFGEMVYGERAHNEVYDTDVAITTEDAGFETKKVTIVFE